MEAYTNEKNPFHDPKLNKVFVWKKKAKGNGWSKSEAKAKAEERRVENLVEIENAKKRRILREEEEEQKRENRERMEREQESAIYAGWEEREEEFMRRQHQQKVALRINEGREKELDAIARNVLLTKQLRFGVEIGPDGKPVSALGNEVGIDSTSPLEFLETLTLEELNEIQQEIMKLRELEKLDSEFRRFWDGLLVIAADRASHLQNPSDQGRILPTAIWTSLHESCSQKTISEISKERNECHMKAVAAEAQSEERAFFEELEKRYLVEENCAFVRDVHESMIETAKKHGRDVHRIGASEKQAVSELPKQVQQNDLQTGDEAGEAHDHKESIYLDLFPLPFDPNKPEKPQCWNRVRTGYDWNKYNRAHYDRDNPPPRLVFGYKFNIYYPGTKNTPKYTFERDPTDSENYCILRFSADAPFSDIAFRIEKRQWERGASTGFKNTFENGLLQLHFNFVKRRYRR